MSIKTRYIYLVFLLLLPAIAGAHPGGLDKHGCHTNRKTGDYHCHRGSTTSQQTPRANIAPPSATTPRRSPPAGRAFRNCDEARAYGAAPVLRGQPGYGQHLDRDNDGIGCEPYSGRRRN